MVQCPGGNPWAFVGLDRRAVNFTHRAEHDRHGLMVRGHSFGEDPWIAAGRFQRLTSGQSRSLARILSAEALQFYRGGLAIAERLAKSEPANAGWQADLSVSHDRVGDVLKDGDAVGALKSYRDGLAIRKRLAKSDPGNISWRHALWVCTARSAMCRWRRATLRARWSPSATARHREAAGQIRPRQRGLATQSVGVV